MDTMYLESFILIKSVIVSGRGLPWVSGSLRLSYPEVSEMVPNRTKCKLGKRPPNLAR